MRVGDLSEPAVAVVGVAGGAARAAVLGNVPGGVVVPGEAVAVRKRLLVGPAEGIVVPGDGAGVLGAPGDPSVGGVGDADLAAVRVGGEVAPLVWTESERT